MLYDLEPDRSVTGGAWYNDQEFESEFVDILNQQCLKLLQSKVANKPATDNRIGLHLYYLCNNTFSNNNSV